MRCRVNKALVGGMLAVMSWAAAAEDGTAEAVVERLHATLLDAMSGGDTLGFRGRFELIGPVLDATFDFDTIARIVTGRHWQSLDDAERSHFKLVFRDLSTATYASNFSAFAGERFTTSGSEDTRTGRVVRTELVEGDGDAVSLHYMLHKRNDNWRIINVVAEGVSDLSLKRAEYTAVIKSEGFDSLVKRLEEKVTEMGRGS